MLPPLQPPLGYEYAITTEISQENWPNLELYQNFYFTSLKRKGFNCVAYALHEENKDLDMLVFARIFGLDKNKLDHSANGYAKIFQEKYGYEKCETPVIEDGFEKIALYENNQGDFTHLALQLPNGQWTSKMGTYEDILHHTLECISGDFYGHPIMFMKKTNSEWIKNIKNLIKSVAIKIPLPIIT